MRKIITIMCSLLVGIPYLLAQDYQLIEYQNEQITQTDRYQKGNDYQKDFLLFMELLQTTHPAFAPEQQRPLNVESLIESGYQQLESCKTLIDFKFFISSILAPIQDEHTFIGLFQGDDTNILYPVNIWLDEDVPYIRVIEKKHEAYLGKQIISINGLSIVDIYSKFGYVVNADNDISLRKKIFETICFPSIWNYIDTDKKDLLLDLEFSDGTSIHLEAKKRSNIKDLVSIEQTIQQSEITSKKEIPFFYSMLEKEKLAYLQFNKCVDQNSARWHYDNSGHADENGNFPPELEEQFQQYPKFDTLLYSMFSEIKSKGISTLVIDVRNNGGGNSELCRQLLSYLSPNVDSLKTFQTSIRISDFFIQYYPELYGFLCKIFPKKIETGRLYRGTDFSVEDTEDESTTNKYFKMNDDISLFFNGTIIFIQGKNTYSSAGDFMVEVRDNKIGTIIGENGRYRPCSYGDILLWKLPNTGTAGGISHKYFTRPDESKCQEYYLAPDVYIPTTLEDYKNGIDPCWEWIKKNYSQK